MSQPGKPSALIKPTLNTKFHIDYDWWDRSRDDLRTYLLSHLPQDVRDDLLQSAEDRLIDHIDPQTGEVFQLDALQLALRDAAQDPAFINPQTSLVDSVFRVFIRNNNMPLSPKQLAEETRRPAATILKTLSGQRIYKGIRPYLAHALDKKDRES